MFNTVKSIMFFTLLLLCGIPAFSQLEFEVQDVHKSERQTELALDQPESDLLSHEIKNSFQIEIVSGLTNSEILLTAISQPNPIDSYLTLCVEKYQENSLTYNLYNKRGKLIDRDDLNTKMTDLDMGGYSDGTYMLKIENNQEVVKTFRITKSN